MTIRQEIRRLIELNEAEQWVPENIAIEQLEHYGDRLVPDLIECLNDFDADVRRLAVTLLCEVRPRPHIAVPALIERLSDSERFVQMEVINNIAEFGPIAAGAIPFLEPWLEFDSEYLRILAATIICRLDRSRTELLSAIKAARATDDPTVRFVVREFFQKTTVPMPFDESEFQESVRRHWNYRPLCQQVYWHTQPGEEGSLEFDVAPVFQEIWGGENDGKRVWSGFIFQSYGFSQEPGVELYDGKALSTCIDECPAPFVGLSGVYFGQRFILRIHLEPIVGTDIREVVDTIRNKVRSIEEEQP